MHTNARNLSVRHRCVAHAILRADSPYTEANNLYRLYAACGWIAIVAVSLILALYALNPKIRAWPGPLIMALSVVRSCSPLSSPHSPTCTRARFSSPSAFYVPHSCHARIYSANWALYACAHCGLVLIAPSRSLGAYATCKRWQLLLEFCTLCPRAGTIHPRYITGYH